ncbi:hypothetical protein L3067_04175 [Xanthomonas sp. PPL568]|uniref:hypothetical protein n=1 Tax=Xanthomonas indica TaxID=2912242 RepID=UPI001F57CF7C|nr:hypothetical protein [Xanthomonas indica]MCI2243804.1 hypothetical protein [Xanthomonas indica]
MPREPDYITEQLRRWGYAQANRYAYSRGGRSVHALEQARDLAPGTVENAMRDLVGRDGTSRRRFMAARSGVEGMVVLPQWAVDAIRSSNDADRPHDNPEIAVDMGIPDDLRWVDRALSGLARATPLRELIVRTEFTVSASQAVKARMVAEQYGGALSLRQYRYELGKALDWCRGRAAA